MRASAAIPRSRVSSPTPAANSRRPRKQSPGPCGPGPLHTARGARFAYAGLESDLHAHGAGVELGAGIHEEVGARGPGRLGDRAVEVVEHEPDVAVHVPVEAGGVDRLLAAGGAIGEAQAVIEVDHAVASGDF